MAKNLNSIFNLFNFKIILSLRARLLFSFSFRAKQLNTAFTYLKELVLFSTFIYLTFFAIFLIGGAKEDIAQPTKQGYSSSDLKMDEYGARAIKINTRLFK